MEQDGARWHHTTQNGAQLKMYKVFIFGTFHLMFSDHSWPQVTETTESETADKGATNVIFYDKGKSQDETL